MLNRIGPSTDPCRTPREGMTKWNPAEPHVGAFGTEMQLLTTAFWELSEGREQDTEEKFILSLLESPGQLAFDNPLYQKSLRG